jgi:antitoxin (DNA-binding transcriptional repressor) of toxin-antitoxin stability system
MRATKVGIREFRSGLAEFIASANPVAVTRHGQTVGYFIPTHGRTDADMGALKKASAEFDRLLAARSVDMQSVTTELKAARKAGKGPVRKSASATRR